jgi:hypothetical protein
MISRASTRAKLPLPGGLASIEGLDRAEKSIICELSGGFGERNNERH